MKNCNNEKKYSRFTVGLKRCTIYVFRLFEFNN